MAGNAEPWRRTGRKANPEHFIGLESGVLIEAAAYNDQGQQQGLLLFLLGKLAEDQGTAGQTWWVQFLGISDGFYQHWLEDRHGKLDKLHEVPIHFCDKKVVGCTERTRYRDAIHVDVFRVLDDEKAKRLSWLSAAQRKFVKNTLDGDALSGRDSTSPVPRVEHAGSSTGSGIKLGGIVAPGTLGLQGLAASLGGSTTGALRGSTSSGLKRATSPASDARVDSDLEGKDDLRERVQSGSSDGGNPSMRALQTRAPRGATESALLLPRRLKDKKKKKR